MKLKNKYTPNYHQLIYQKLNDDASLEKLDDITKPKHSETYGYIYF